MAHVYRRNGIVGFHGSILKNAAILRVGAIVIMYECTMMEGFFCSHFNYRHTNNHYRRKLTTVMMANIDE